MGLNRRLSELQGRFVEFFSEEASASPIAKWVGGVIVPLPVAAYALWCLLTQSGTIVGRGGTVHLSGSIAVGYGIALLGLALFLSAHFFFSNTRRCYVVSEVGRPWGLILLAGGLFYVLFRWFTST